MWGKRLSTILTVGVVFAFVVWWTVVVILILINEYPAN